MSAEFKCTPRDHEKKLESIFKAAQVETGDQLPTSVSISLRERETLTDIQFQRREMFELFLKMMGIEDERAGEITTWVMSTTDCNITSEELTHLFQETSRFSRFLSQLVSDKGWVDPDGGRTDLFQNGLMALYAKLQRYAMDLDCAT